MRDEVTEVQAYATVAIRPEVAQYGDIVAGVVNLKYRRGAIGNIESYVQCAYGYDMRTEIVGSRRVDSGWQLSSNRRQPS